MSPTATTRLSSRDDRWMLDLMSEPVNRYRISDRVITYCNTAWANYYGTSKSEAVGRCLDQFLSADELDGMYAQLAVIGPSNPVLVDEAARALDGHRWLEWVDRYVETDDGAQILSVGRDVTDRYLAECRLVESEHRFRSIADQASDIVWRVKTSPTIRFEYLSPSTLKILGYPASYLMADFERIIEISEPETRLAIHRVIAGERLPDRIDFRFRHAHGHVVVGESTSSRSGDGIQGVVRDVTEVRDLQASLRAMASTDSLTGLVNRRAFEQELEMRCAEAAAVAQSLTIVYLDLDEMKAVNDCHDHSSGDVVLAVTARRLRAACDANDVVARLGGDEFAVVRSATSFTDPQWLDNLGALLAEPIDIGNDIEVTCTASIGTASTDVYGYRPSELLAAADRAMYRTKHDRRRRRDDRDDRRHRVAAR